MNVSMYVRGAIHEYQHGLINLSELIQELVKLRDITEVQKRHTLDLERMHNNLSQWLIDKAEHEE